MTTDQLALWQRIAAHSFDDPAASHPFSVRLAKENRWSLAVTRRAIEEYRRFVFLAVASGHPVSPSDAIDQVWHLHLLYTRDYWGEFCPNVLRTPLHHGPTRGGRTEVAKFSDWYAQTLASYRRFFGEPPADLWPVRPHHPRAARVDLDTHWVVPKPRLGRRRAARVPPAPTPSAPATLPAQGGALTALVLIGVCVALPTPAHAAEDMFWPFNLRGPEFLGFYAWFAPLMFVLALALRWYASRGAAPRVHAAKLDPYEIAHLAGGETRVLEAVLASLRQRGLVEFQLRKVVRTAQPAPDNLPLLERATLAAIARDGSAPGDLQEAIASALAANEATLVENGLLLSEAAASSARNGAFAVALVAPVVGFIKVVLGLLRERPVAFIVILSVIALLVALVAFRRRLRLTARGKEILAHLEAENARLGEMNDASLAAPDFGTTLPLAVALFGLGALSHTALAGIEQDLEPLAQRRAQDDGGGYFGWDDGGSSDSSSSDSGGDGGGGGDGGSGCGGCGGGGGGD